MTRAVLLIGGSEKHHDLFGAADALCRTLAAAGIATRVSQDLNMLSHPRMDDVDLFLAYMEEKEMTPAQQEALERRLHEGKGFVPIHVSNVIREPYPSYARIVGSRFISHPPFGRFQVRVNTEHPVTAGIGDFAIDDELYLTEWTGAPGQVLATADYQGAAVPMVYARTEGRGRVCYIALGHDGRSWHHPAFKRLLVQASLWSAGKSTES